jgi:hypothetical protein
MKTDLNFDLINGTFKPLEAKSILLILLKNKINFHELEIFSSQERFGKDLPHSKKRITELKESMANVEIFFQELANLDTSIKITSSVEISAVEKKEKNESF